MIKDKLQAILSVLSWKLIILVIVSLCVGFIIGQWISKSSYSNEQNKIELKKKSNQDAMKHLESEIKQLEQLRKKHNNQENS